MSRGYGTTFGVSGSDAILTPNVVLYKTQMSFSIWLYINGAGPFGFGVAIYANDGGSQSASASIEMRGSSSAIGFTRSWTGSSSGNANWHCTAPPLNQWHHFAITYDGSSLLNVPLMYIDGLPVSVTTDSPPLGILGTVNLSHVIGNAGNGQLNWDGMLADACIWNGVIVSGADIFAIASGLPPNLVRPEFQVNNLPLDGINNKEFDYAVGYSSTITGTKLGTSNPSQFAASRARPLFDYQASGATFKAAWALGRNAAYPHAAAS